jgi:sister-chromatid-cohesion protein PDS5
MVGLFLTECQSRAAFDELERCRVHCALQNFFYLDQPSPHKQRGQTRVPTTICSVNMVAKTRAGGQNSPKKLKFNDKLVNRGLSTDALLKKLKALQTELAEMDQELVDVNLLGSVRKELVSTSILLHKDRGVKAYAACCLADILRLYAPDAPYTHTELRDIFTFFFRQLLDGLTGSDASYYDEFFQLLESLSTVKSVVLVCDLPHAEELMVNIFRDCFTLARRDLVRKLEMFLADILVVLIDECQVVPGDVLEALMSQFMDKNAVRYPDPFPSSVYLIPV